MTITEGSMNAAGLRLAAVVSRFNEFITRPLLDGALGAVARHGGDPEELRVMWVPGAVEIPLVAQTLAASGDYDAVIALGCVIRGATSHYDYVCSMVASGVNRAALDTGVPVIFGVLTTDTLEQAIERAGSKAGNKGAEAALAAVEMATLMRALRPPGGETTRSV